MDTLQEEWRQVKGWEGFYEVSSLGRVKSLARNRGNGKGVYRIEERILKQIVNKHGYLYVGLSDPKKTMKVHRLVLTAFRGEPPIDKPTCNHIDGIKANNNIENLEWVSHTDNIRHAFKNNLIKRHCGEKHFMAKLTYKQVDDIRCRYSSKSISCASLAKEFQMSLATISNIVSFRSWKK